jgi:regulator of replication initiation timing
VQQRFSITEANAAQLAGAAGEKNRLEQELLAVRTETRNLKSITESEIQTLRIENAKLRQELEHQTGSRSELDKYRTECDRLRVELDRLR